MEMKKRTKSNAVKYRVAKGIRFLNEEYGKSWLRKIDPERLALESGKACILGQVEDDYDDAQEKLGLGCEECEKLGFTSRSTDDEKRGREFDRLTRAWRQSVIKLQKLFHIQAPSREGLY